jgi:dipeptidyl aminopeptidase/acylaminoacyl peptidase
MMQCRSCLLTVLIMAVTMATSAPGSSSPDSVPSIESFMKIGLASRPQISDDGSRIFFTYDCSGESQLYRLMDSGWPYQMTVFDDAVEFFRISPSGDRIVVGTSIGGSEQSDLYLVETSTGRISTLLYDPDIRYRAVIWGPEGRYIYYHSNQENGRDFMIYRMDLETRRVQKVWDHEGYNYPAAVSPDGTHLLVEYYESNVNSFIHLVDVDTGAATLLADHDRDFVFESPAFTPDGRSFYFLTNMNPDGLLRVARMEIGRQDFEFVSPQSRWEVEEMELSPDGRYLVWVENAGGYGNLYVRDLSTGETRKIEELAGRVRYPDLSGQGTVVFRFSGPTQPPDIWQLDIPRGELRQLTHVTLAGIDQSLFFEPRLVHYESFDGLDIPAYLYLPPDWDGRPIPFVVHAHGGPEGQFRPSFIRHFQYLALNGFGILAPNIRGSRGYGREYIALDDYKKRKDSVRDIGAAADWLVDQGYAEYGRIGIKGASYGGYMTLAAMVEFPGKWGAGIDHIGIANFVTFLENTKAYRRAIREAEYGPLTDREFLTEISPLTHVDRISAPLLVVHGENDSRVPVGEARQIAEAVVANGGEAELLIFPDEGHGVAKLENTLVYYRRMVDFLDRHLKP